MDSKPAEISSSKMFGGFNKRYKHFSPTLGCSMTFSIFFPSLPSPSHKFPVLYWLSGLACTDENFITKSGAQRVASSEGVALIAPDTSPRGLNVEGESDSWDFGVGAGFYLNAKQEKWKNWQMYDYVVKELPALVSANFPELDTSRASISGHSMGGHGALTIYLKNLDKYKSVSAFAPVVNPVNCPWGQKAFTNYLGGSKEHWEEYDATCLVSKFNDVSATILIDQGEEDKFKDEQLLPNNFEEACRKAKVTLLLRRQPGYDHSYYFISTFIDDHIRHHAQALSLVDDSLQTINVRLDDKNYSYWSYAMKKFLSDKRMWGYISGNIVSPKVADDNYVELLDKWDTNNSKIITWINNSVKNRIGMQLVK